MTTCATENRPDHHYRTEIPNIVFELGLTPQAIALYAYFKRIAGDYGQCWKSKETILKETGLSVNAYLKYRKELNTPQKLLRGLPLIHVHIRLSEKRGNDTTQVEIVDIWRLNGEYFRNEKKIRESQKRTGGVSKMNEGSLKNEHEEEPSEEEPHEEEKKTPPNPLKGDGVGKAPPIKNRYGENGHVLLTDSEYTKLLEKMSEIERAEWIESLDIEAGKIGPERFNKKYKSHYFTILSWKKYRSQKGSPDGHKSNTGAFRGEKVDRRTRDENGVPDEAPHLKGLF